MNHREILCQKVIAPDDLRFGLMAFGQRQKRRLQLTRPHVGGGRVDQIAGQEFGFGHDQQARGVGVAGLQKGWLRRGFAGAIAVETIALQEPCKGDFAALCGG